MRIKSWKSQNNTFYLICSPIWLCICRLGLCALPKHILMLRTALIRSNPTIGFSFVLARYASSKSTWDHGSYHRFIVAWHKLRVEIACFQLLIRIPNLSSTILDATRQTHETFTNPFARLIEVRIISFRNISIQLCCINAKGTSTRKHPSHLLSPFHLIFSVELFGNILIFGHQLNLPTEWGELSHEMPFPARFLTGSTLLRFHPADLMNHLGQHPTPEFRSS